jgi:hypothetical protein
VGGQVCSAESPEAAAAGATGRSGRGAEPCLSISYSTMEEDRQANRYDGSCRRALMSTSARRSPSAERCWNQNWRKL